MQSGTFLLEHVLRMDIVHHCPTTRESMPRERSTPDNAMPRLNTASPIVSTKSTEGLGCYFFGCKKGFLDGIQRSAKVVFFRITKSFLGDTKVFSGYKNKKKTLIKIQKHHEHYNNTKLFFFFQKCGILKKEKKGKRKKYFFEKKKFLFFCLCLTIHIATALHLLLSVFSSRR